MPASDLLIDQVYRSCFYKKQPRPALRAALENARRFVLDDAMSAFLADLNFQTFTGRYLRIKPHRRFRHFCRGIDSVRHFARLPYKMTWVEYSEASMNRRTREIIRDEKVDDILVWGGKDPNEVCGSKVAWLCWQHEKIETAFSARSWARRDDGESGSSPIALMWDTEDGTLPWRQMPFVVPVLQELGVSASEWAVLAKGYVRDNVGFRNVSGDLDTPRHDENSDLMRIAQEQLVGRMQALWTFLSTLNKIPIVGERKIERSHGFIARGRYRRFLDHSIITLTIPAKADSLKIAHRVTADLRRRAHLVRGHWRDDWRKPKGNKSLWIAEHQRGDASIGFVTHDYKIEHEDASLRGSDA